MLKIDGSYGEGGGQIIRTALTLSCITSLPVEIYNIRAGRDKPGLRPQHLTCVNAAASICDAEVVGGQVGSDRLMFRPGRHVRAGHYQWKIGTAGAATLVIQTVILPLVMTGKSSLIEVSGGTHVPFSPSGHYLRDVYAPLLVQSGADVMVELRSYGWYPKGGGDIAVVIEGSGALIGQQLTERGELERIFGIGVATNLPATIPQRMTTRLLNELEAFNVSLDIRPKVNKGLSSGAGLFITTEYANGRAGFGILGEKGLPSEEVAEMIINAFKNFHNSPATVDEHLADQLLLILALATGSSHYITPEVTPHLETNRWVIQQFLERTISIDATGNIIIAG